MANGDIIVSQGEANQALPGTVADGNYKNIRVGKYGDVSVQSLAGGKMYGVADEGSYFVATNPTPGTGIAGIAAADGFDDLEALIYLRNTEATKRIYLDYISLNVTAAGTNGTNFNYAMKLDTGNARYASGGTAITPKNVNIESSNSCSCSMYFGAVVPTAATADARLINHRRLRSVIKVIGDTYLFDFGGCSKSLSGMPMEGTLQANVVVPCPPVVIGPGDTFLFHEWAASQSVAASYEFEVGFWVR